MRAYFSAWAYVDERTGKMADLSKVLSSLRTAPGVTMADRIFTEPQEIAGVIEAESLERIEEITRNLQKIKGIGSLSVRIASLLQDS